MTLDDQPGQPSRRALLGGLGAASALGALGLAGCTPSDPRISSDGPSATGSARPTSRSSGSASPRPSSAQPSSARPATARPSPTTPPSGATSWAAGSAAELALGGLALAVRDGPHRAELGAARRRLLSGLAVAHGRHATALAGPQPTTRPLSPAVVVQATPPAGFARLSLAAALDLLRRQETAQQQRARTAALGTRGLESLLWGSLSVAAGCYAAALTSTSTVPVAAASDDPAPLAPVSDVEALQSVLRQLHALVYGYQLALGHLPATKTTGVRALASLRAHRRQRDQISATLATRAAGVPAAAGAYTPSVNPTSAARAARLVRRMETAFEPFCGLWLASASRSTDRLQALTTLERTVLTARSWNAPVSVWPGWPD